MQAFLLGLLALGIVLFVLEGFTRANPSLLARQLKVMGGIIALFVAAAFFFRGGVAQAMILGAVGSGLLGWRSGAPWWPGASTKSPGQSSGVTTDHLDMELDHDTGAMTGRMLKGMFAGRDIESLKPAELALLWQDCRFSDPQSAQIIEAYLDRIHPSWREDMARGEAGMRGADGRISVADAYEILGLAPGADEDAIRRAHRELIVKVHPDRGGSSYLAAQINEAKDVLLARFDE